MMGNLQDRRLGSVSGVGGAVGPVCLDSGMLIPLGASPRNIRDPGTASESSARFVSRSLSNAQPPAGWVGAYRFGTACLGRSFQGVLGTVHRMVINEVGHRHFALRA